MKRIVLGAVVAVVFGLGGAPGYADPVTPTGVTVNGNGGHTYILGACSTCPIDGSTGSDSKQGAVSATTNGPATEPFNWMASATLGDGLQLPELKAMAAAYDPGPASGIFSMYTYASASAQALQFYTYTGTEEAAYTIEYTVDGSVSGDDESVSAGVSIFKDDYIPGMVGENPNVSLPLAVSRYTTPGAGLFAHTGSVTFSMQPGQGIYVAAFLTANAFWSDGGSLPGIADASHTFTSAFAGGNTSLLQAGLPTPPPTPVPEPATITTGLLGLASLTASRRLRRSC